MSRINYSKWDHIEVSDDEDDTHPNIDTPSLFRWRHQARVERDAQFNEDKNKFEADYKSHLNRLENAKQKLNSAKQAGNVSEEDMNALIAELAKCEEDDKEWKMKEQEIRKKERLKPWNIDTMCKEGQSRTIINKPKEEQKAETEKDCVERLHNFVQKNEKLIRKFGMFGKPDDSENFLLEHPFLVCEETANHLVIWCIDLAVEEKMSLMNHVTHQTIVMQFMLELAKSLKIDPRACIRPFFSKFKAQEPEYMRAFQDELDAFRERVKKRAEIRIQEAMEKYEAEERQKRLGPGGLDPVEVFETLPEELQKCFESKDVELLKSTIANLPPDQAEYHMKRCVASGLWVPEKASDSGLIDCNDEQPAEEAEGDAREESPYETVD